MGHEGQGGSVPCRGGRPGTLSALFPPVLGNRLGREPADTPSLSWCKPPIGCPLPKCPCLATAAKAALGRDFPSQLAELRVSAGGREGGPGCGRVIGDLTLGVATLPAGEAEPVETCGTDHLPRTPPPPATPGQGSGWAAGREQARGGNPGGSCIHVPQLPRSKLGQT